MKKRKSMKKKIVAIVSAVLMVGTMSIPVSAGNISYAFNLGNTGKLFKTYTGGSNEKVYSGDSASVRISSGYGPGYGFAFIMQYKTWVGYSAATLTSPPAWLSGSGMVHPVYASGQNKTGRDYYVAARIDDDYSGTYSCRGYFNSDYVD